MQSEKVVFMFQYGFEIPMISVLIRQGPRLQLPFTLAMPSSVLKRQVPLNLPRPEDKRERGISSVVAMDTTERVSLRA